MSQQSVPDPVAILAALNIPAVSRVTRVEGGADTTIWRVEQGSATYALRLFRPEQLETFRGEQEAMRVASAAGLPVPLVHAAGIVQDRPALLLSWMSGQTLMRQLQMHPAQVRKLGVAFGQMQAAIHRVPVPPDVDDQDWIAWAGEREALLQERLRALPSKGRALLHLDYHPLNVMTNGNQITAVLDWANAHAGDPRADFARTRVILSLDPFRPPAWYIRLFFRVLERAWRYGYLHSSGALEDMPLFYAWAGAVMVRDLAHRVNQPGSSVQDRHLDPVRRWTSYWKRRAGLAEIS